VNGFLSGTTGDFEGEIAWVLVEIRMVIWIKFSNDFLFGVNLHTCVLNNYLYRKDK